MGLTKPNQEPRRDLKKVAALLKWSGVDIMQCRWLPVFLRLVLRMMRGY